MVKCATFKTIGESSDLAITYSTNAVPKTRISAYFEVVTRALQHADRSTVMEHLRSCFKNFLEALDVGQVDEEVS